MISAHLSAAARVSVLNVGLFELSSVEFHQQVIFSDSPQNMNVSVESVEIIEDEAMESILCSAEAYPGPSYYWTLNNEVTVCIISDTRVAK